MHRSVNPDMHWTDIRGKLNDPVLVKTATASRQQH